MKKNWARPIFTVKASNCLRDASCEDIQSRGICDGLKQLSYEPYPFQKQIDFEKEACQ